MTEENDPAFPGTEIPALLLIEDDPAVAAFIQDALQTYFFVNVLVAMTADQARSLWQQHDGSIVAILSDLNLPGESGLSVVRDLAMERPGMLVVFTTGDVYREPEIVASMGAAVRLLSKPFKPSELSALFGAVRPSKRQ
jgi:DNA-binding response OmpR family regulator